MTATWRHFGAAAQGHMGLSMRGSYSNLMPVLTRRAHSVAESAATRFCRRQAEPGERGLYLAPSGLGDQLRLGSLSGWTRRCRRFVAGMAQPKTAVLSHPFNRRSMRHQPWAVGIRRFSHPVRRRVPVAPSLPSPAAPRMVLCNGMTRRM